MPDADIPPRQPADPKAPLSRRRKRARDPLPDVFTGRRRRGLALVIAAGVGQGAVWAGLGVLMKTAFDRVAADGWAGAGRDAVLIFLALAIGGVAAGLLKWLAHVEAERVGQSYAHALRMRLFRRLVEAGGTRQSRRGAVLLRLTSDMTPIRQWVSLGLSQLIVSVPTIALAVGALAYIDWRIAAPVSAMLLVAGAASVLLGRKLAEATVAARKSRGRLANAAGERIVNPADAAAPQDKRAERRKLRKLSRRVRNSLLDRAYYAGAMRAIAAGSGAMAGILALGAALAAPPDAPISAGALLSAVFIASVLAPYAHDASRSLEYWTAAKIAREKQRELFRRLARGEKPRGEALAADFDGEE